MKRLLVVLCAAPLLTTQVAHAQTAQVKPYKVSASLREVSNLKAFSKAIPMQAAQKQMLARNLFVCTPTSAQQLFHIYENNDYLNVPSFITSDGVLQLYHIFFDFTLRKVESESLFPILKTLTGGMVKQSVATWRALRTPTQSRRTEEHRLLWHRIAPARFNHAAAARSRAAGAKRAGFDCGACGFGQGAIFPLQVRLLAVRAARPLHAQPRVAALFQSHDVVWPGAVFDSHRWPAQRRTDSPGIAAVARPVCCRPER
jgi:hypothetical protein